MWRWTVERGRGMLGVHAVFVEEKRVLRYHKFWPCQLCRIVAGGTVATAFFGSKLVVGFTRS